MKNPHFVTEGREKIQKAYERLLVVSSAITCLIEELQQWRVLCFPGLVSCREKYTLRPQGQALSLPDCSQSPNCSSEGLQTIVHGPRAKAPGTARHFQARSGQAAYLVVPATPFLLPPSFRIQNFSFHSFRSHCARLCAEHWPSGHPPSLIPGAAMSCAPVRAAFPSLLLPPPPSSTCLTMAFTSTLGILLVLHPAPPLPRLNNLCIPPFLSLLLTVVVQATTMSALDSFKTPHSQAFPPPILTPALTLHTVIRVNLLEGKCKQWKFPC